MIVFLVRDRYYPGYTANKAPRWREIQRKPKLVYELEGEQLELYPVSVLAEAIGRTKKTILRWEAENKFSPPMFDVPASHYTVKGKLNKPRWYSKEQVMNLHNLFHKKYHGMKTFNTDGVLDLFLKDLRRVFYSRVILSEKEL